MTIHDCRLRTQPRTGILRGSLYIGDSGSTGSFRKLKMEDRIFSSLCARAEATLKRSCSEGRLEISLNAQNADSMEEGGDDSANTLLLANVYHLLLTLSNAGRASGLRHLGLLLPCIQAELIAPFCLPSRQAFSSPQSSRSCRSSAICNGPMEGALHTNEG